MPHLAPADAQPIVVETQHLQAVAAGTLEQVHYALDATGTEGIVAEIQFHQPAPSRHDGCPQVFLNSTRDVDQVTPQ